MFFIESIKAFIARRAAAKQLRIDKENACNLAIQAIQAQDVEKLTAALNRNDWSMAQVWALFMSAIDSDNVEIFALVLDSVYDGDPNRTLYSHTSTGPEGPSFLTQISLLSRAITQRKQNIAIWLAKNPRTDVTVTNQHTSFGYEGGGLISSGHSTRKERRDPAPVALALANQMPLVAAAIYERLEEDAHNRKLAALAQE
jgi:hypothetical protein